MLIPDEPLRLDFNAMAIRQARWFHSAPKPGNAVQSRLNLAIAPHERIGVAAHGIPDLYVPTLRQQAQITNLAGLVRKGTPDSPVVLLVEDEDDVRPAHLRGAQRMRSMFLKVHAELLGRGDGCTRRRPPVLRVMARRIHLDTGKRQPSQTFFGKGTATDVAFAHEQDAPGSPHGAGRTMRHVQP